MKRKVDFVLMVILAVIICWGVFFIIPSQSEARVTNIEGAKFDTSISLADNLKGFIGKHVYLHLKSGITLQGYLKAVGNNLIHLEKLAGKDFYDALISIEEISAIEAQFRKMK
jgi:hypothetical protein